MYYLYLDNELISESTELCEIAEIVIVELLNDCEHLQRSLKLMDCMVRSIVKRNRYEISLPHDSEAVIYYGERQ